MKLLAPLDSRISNIQGFCTLDFNSNNVEYFEFNEKFNYKRKGFRGGCVVGNKIYVCNSFSLKAYDYTVCSDGLNFELSWQLSLPEWLCGNNANSDLHTVYFREKTNTLLVANSFLDCIEEVSLDGKHLSRRYLWQVSQEIERLLCEKNSKAANLCHINHFFEFNDSVYAVLGNINGSGEGGFLNIETGHISAFGLGRPHDGVFHGQRLWVCETSMQRIKVFKDFGSVDGLTINSCSDLIDFRQYITRMKRGRFWLRGLTLQKNYAYVGFSQFQERPALLSEKDSSSSMNDPTFVLKINCETFEIEDELEVIGEKGLSQPVVYNFMLLS